MKSRTTIWTSLLAGLLMLPTSPAALAFDPLTSLIGKGISTAMDVRTKADVQADVEIDTAGTKKLLEHKGDDFKDVALLVFARHAVLVGYAKSEDVKRQAGQLLKGDTRIRSMQNQIVVNKAAGGFAGNMLLDKKIDLSLTATKGVSSVNMRWKVYGGEVFLTGVAQSDAEAKLAVSTIKGLDGVKVVRSSLRIVKK